MCLKIIFNLSGMQRFFFNQMMNIQCVCFYIAHILFVLYASNIQLIVVKNEFIRKSRGNFVSIQYFHYSFLNNNSVGEVILKLCFYKLVVKLLLYSSYSLEKVLRYTTSC